MKYLIATSMAALICDSKCTIPKVYSAHCKPRFRIFSYNKWTIEEAGKLAKVIKTPFGQTGKASNEH